MTMGNWYYWSFKDSHSLGIASTLSFIGPWQWYSETSIKGRFDIVKTRKSLKEMKTGWS
jgi:hypothetical protein